MNRRPRVRKHLTVLVLTLVLVAAAGGLEPAYASTTGGGGSGCTPHSWLSLSGTTTSNVYYSDGVTPKIFINWTVKYDGCHQPRYQYLRCSAVTILVSMKFNWCGFYVPSGQTYIDVGANWTDYSTPVAGIGASWGDYQRQRIYSDGSRSATWPNLP